jgi:glutamine amidotransferase
MQNLEKRKVVEPVKEYICDGKPFLGVCLGMQMMLEASGEVHDYQGLGVIEGRVVPLPSVQSNGVVNRIPHIGWGRLLPPGKVQENLWENTILRGVDSRSYVYFVHSFQAEPTGEASVVAKTEFGDEFFVSVIRRGNAFGVQFHPEKSGEVGLKILRNFLSM